jgi:hypothetical protein
LASAAPSTLPPESRIVPLECIKSITPIPPVIIKQEPEDEEADVVITAFYNAKKEKQCTHCRVALLCKMCNTNK